MATGKVTRWNGHNGDIRDDADGELCFFRAMHLQLLQPGDMKIGLEVEFDRRRNYRGPMAGNVRRRGAGGAAPAPPTATPLGKVDAPTQPKMGVAVPPKKIVVNTMNEEQILSQVPVPASLRQLLETLGKDRQRHPGLMLDRFLKPCPKQEQQREVLNVVVGLEGDTQLLADHLARRIECLRALGARTWSRTTQGPLTLHLARASALENAGLCLHPIYGFAYLPGTGLKGMARAYAETVWLPSQRDPIDAWQSIEQVFGWSPGSDEIDRKPKAWKPPGVPKRGDKDQSAAGDIVFHDAWPEKWPGLVVDIVNNHHPKYYQGEDAPGDWDSPIPVYFLAVKPGTTFSFALSKRRGDVDIALLDRAREWLDGALTVLGCGAKTAAGYGAFTPDPARPIAASPALARASYTLELVTPAYLAGASQRKEDCDLRSATLRGLLRWWWRTIHTGYMPWQTLRDLEAAVWGDTSTGGAVQVRVTRNRGEAVPSPYKAYNAQNKLGFSDAFGEQHQMFPKVGLGLIYAGYGMDEMASPGPGQPSQRRQRWCVQPPASWQVELTARAGMFRQRDSQGKILREVRLSDLELLLDQARTALWWFCKLGGAGSKSRKGFGSFGMPATLETFEGHRWILQGNRLRSVCGMPEAEFRDELVAGPSLKLMRRLSMTILGDDPPWIQVQTHCHDPWRVLAAVGSAMARCAQSKGVPHGKHQPQKRGLGLPRKIHGPRNQPMNHQNPKEHEPPLELECARGGRHSSPVLFHVTRRGKELDVHVAGFPTADLREDGMQELPGLKAHERFLAEYLRQLQDELREAL